MATGYSLSIVSDWKPSTKTAIEKFKQLPSFANNGGFLNRKNYVIELESKGYQYSDNPEIGWFIVVDYEVYKVAEMTKDEFSDPYVLLGDRIYQLLDGKKIDDKGWLTEPKPDPEKDPEKTNPPGGSGNKNSDAAPGSFIQGVSNNTLYAVAGFLVLIIVLISSKKWLR